MITRCKPSSSTRAASPRASLVCYTELAYTSRHVWEGAKRKSVRATILPSIKSHLNVNTWQLVAGTQLIRNGKLQLGERPILLVEQFLSSSFDSRNIHYIRISLATLTLLKLRQPLHNHAAYSLIMDRMPYNPATFLFYQAIFWHISSPFYSTVHIWAITDDGTLPMVWIILQSRLNSDRELFDLAHATGNKILKRFLKSVEWNSVKNFNNITVSSKQEGSGAATLTLANSTLFNERPHRPHFSVGQPVQVLMKIAKSGKL